LQIRYEEHKWNHDLVGQSLISLRIKKKACVALFTTKAEYISTGSCCAQILWLKQQINDFVRKLKKVPIMRDSVSVINLTKSPVSHSITKHIEIRHHFIKDHVSNGGYEIQFVETVYQFLIYSLNHSYRTNLIF